jgi:hypothetical protein
MAIEPHVIVATWHLHCTIIVYIYYRRLFARRVFYGGNGIIVDIGLSTKTGEISGSATRFSTLLAAAVFIAGLNWPWSPDWFSAAVLGTGSELCREAGKSI